MKIIPQGWTVPGVFRGIQDLDATVSVLLLARDHVRRLSPGLRTNSKSRSQSLDQRGSESKLLAPCSSRTCWLLPTLPTAPVLKELDLSVNWSDLDPREGLGCRRR